MLLCIWFACNTYGWCSFLWGNGMKFFIVICFWRIENVRRASINILTGIWSANNLIDQCMHMYAIYPVYGIIISNDDYVQFLSFSENTGKLQVHTQIAQPFIFGSSADLFCTYNYSSTNAAFATSKYPSHANIYSLKWYKDNTEFFR